MSRIFLGGDLEGVATYWRIERRDGVALGFTSHDRDLTFDGLVFRAAPGMLPSAIRRTAGLELESAEVEGALSHDAIRTDDLLAGRFDFAKIQIGLVDWETLEFASLYFGEIGPISSDDTKFQAEMRSSKADLQLDFVPRTSPTCRARFCGPGCNLSAHRFTHLSVVTQIDWSTGKVNFDSGLAPLAMRDGSLRWVDGPHVGTHMEVLDADATGLLLDTDLSAYLAPGHRAILREGCDHTWATCSARFANSVNFQGEPFLPGNDALIRYPTSSS